MMKMRGVLNQTVDNWSSATLTQIKMQLFLAMMEMYSKIRQGLRIRVAMIMMMRWAEPWLVWWGPLRCQADSCENMTSIDEPYTSISCSNLDVWPLLKTSNWRPLVSDGILLPAMTNQQIQLTTFNQQPLIGYVVSLLLDISLIFP